MVEIIATKVREKFDPLSQQMLSFLGHIFIKLSKYLLPFPRKLGHVSSAACLLCQGQHLSVRQQTCARYARTCVTLVKSVIKKEHETDLSIIKHFARSQQF